MSAPTNPESAPRDLTPQLKATQQYSLRSLLVTTVTVSMVLAFVRMFGVEGFRLAAYVTLLALLGGGLFGWLWGRLVETLTWSMVGGVLALFCVLSAGRLEPFQQTYWLDVGVITGALAGRLLTASISLRLGWGVVCWLLCGLTLVIKSPFDDGWFDWLLTLPVAMGLQLLVEAVARLQAKYHTTLDMWAAGIVFAVIVGNFGAIIVWSLWYSWINLGI